MSWSHFLFVTNGNLAVCGDSLPLRLKEWLEIQERLTSNVERRPGIRAVLGPGEDCFVAWEVSGSALLWESIPPLLETELRTWRIPSGWAKGAPRFIALGPSGSYVAWRESGKSAWNIPNTFPMMKEAWVKLWGNSSLTSDNLAVCMFPNRFLQIKEGVDIHVIRPHNG